MLQWQGRGKPSRMSFVTIVLHFAWTYRSLPCSGSFSFLGEPARPFYRSCQQAKVFEGKVALQLFQPAAIELSPVWRRRPSEC